MLSDIFSTFRGFLEGGEYMINGEKTCSMGDTRIRGREEDVFVCGQGPGRRKTTSMMLACVGDDGRKGVGKKRP